MKKNNHCLILKPVSLTPRVIRMLESRQLIRPLRPTRGVLNLDGQPGKVDVIYTSHPRFGPHKLICVGLQSSAIQMNSHPDNEEFIILSMTNRVFKPLLIIIGLHKHAVLESKAKGNTLSASDFITVRWSFNHPQLSVFTMLKDTVHCEAVPPNATGCPPVFFVAESSRLHMRHLKLRQYNLQLAR